MPRVSQTITEGCNFAPAEIYGIFSADYARGEGKFFTQSICWLVGSSVEAKAAQAPDAGYGTQPAWAVALFSTSQSVRSAGGRFNTRVRTLTTGRAMLRAQEALQPEFAGLQRAMRAVARENKVWRLMTVPGVGALIAVTFISAVDDPERFARSRVVGGHVGLTPKKDQSGETDTMEAVRRGAIRWCARRSMKEPTSC